LKKTKKQSAYISSGDYFSVSMYSRTFTIL